MMMGCCASCCWTVREPARYSVPQGRTDFVSSSHEEVYIKRGVSLAVVILYRTHMSKVCRKFERSVNTACRYPFAFCRRNEKRTDAKHLLFFIQLAKLFLLRARSLRFLAALDARAFIMLTLAELGKRTRLGARTLETAQRAVNRFIFLDADLRHSFPSLRAFPSGGTLCTVSHAAAHKTVRILYLFLPSVSTAKFNERPD